MSESKDDLPPQFRSLFSAVCDETATEEQFRELEDLIRGDEHARQLYLAYCELHIHLHFAIRHERTHRAICENIRREESQMFGSAGPAVSPSTSCHSPNYQFTSGWPMAYLVATVLTGVGLIIGALINNPNPIDVAQKLRTPTTAREGSQIATQPETPIVGRITGMVDCKWNEDKAQGSRLKVHGSVALGQQFALASGLVEITYETGAKVVLQGPVTYGADSATGGYLTVGRLTACVEKGSRNKVQGPRAELSPLPSPLSTLHSPLFTIHTPTATVTDLGTEFGVEVNARGETWSHVFTGVVDVQTSQIAGQPRQNVRLTKDESVRVERPRSGNGLKVRRVADDASAFVRVEQIPKMPKERLAKPVDRWRAYSQQLRKDPALLAYYTFESTGRDSWLLPNAATAGTAMDAQIKGPLWASGRFPGKVALRFRGSGTGDSVVLPEIPQSNFARPFSVAVWFQVGEFAPNTVPVLVSKGGPQAWRLQRFGSTNCLTIDPITDEQYKRTPHTDVADHRWHLAVAVIEPNKSGHRKCLYLDGRLEAEANVPWPLKQSNYPIWIGASQYVPGREFAGKIDEAAVLARALAPKEITAMFEAGNPPNTEAR